MLVTGNMSPRTRSRTDPIVSHHYNRHKGSVPLRHLTTHNAVSFRPPPRDVFFSIDASRPRGEVRASRTRPNSSQCSDPMHEYFPGVHDNDHAYMDQVEPPAGPRVQSRCESVPLPATADEDTENGQTDPIRSETAPPSIDLPLQLPDLANLNMKADDVATVGIEKEQQKFIKERRLTISSAMGSRQHGSPRIDSLSGTPRRKLLEREQAYLVMKFHERPCLRTESFINDELYSEVNNMSRECCDVLGPKACHECDRLNRRSNSALRNEANFPSIHISAANFSTLTLVHRVRPDLKAHQVLERLAHGDISRQSIRRKNSKEQRHESSSEDDSPPERKTSVSAFQVPDGLGFFTNFTDLRAQIFARKRGQKQFNRSGRFKQVASSTANNLPAITDVELIPKKESERENPANYFGPPMLSRAEIERQKSQPRFYAGAKGKYELPEAPSLDEIALKATGARHHRLRAQETRSDTPDSDVSTWSMKSTRKDEQIPGDSKRETEKNDEIVPEAGSSTNLVDLES